MTLAHDLARWNADVEDARADYAEFPIRACTVPGCFNLTNGHRPCTGHQREGWR